MNKDTVDMREWRENRYRVFNEKIDSFSSHPHYGPLRRYADKAINDNEGCGLDQILASEFIRRIEQMPLDFIAEWVEGKNKLKWTEIQRDCGQKP